MGKPKHSNDTRGEQKGAQTHAEGQHGDRTLERLRQQTNDEGAQRETHSQREASDPNRAGKGTKEVAHEHERHINPIEPDGRHRLFENRHQHDEADQNSGKNRLVKDVRAHGHDAEQFQIPGGRETHPALPPDDQDRAVKSPGKGG